MSPIAWSLLSGDRLGGVERVYDVLDADSLVRDEQASVAANRGNERCRPAVLVDDHRGRATGFNLRCCSRDVLVVEQACGCSRERGQVTGRVLVKVGEVKAREGPIRVFSYEHGVDYADDSAVHELKENWYRLAGHRRPGRVADHDHVDRAEFFFVAFHIGTSAELSWVRYAFSPPSGVDQAGHGNASPSMDEPQ